LRRGAQGGEQQSSRCDRDRSHGYHRSGRTACSKPAGLSTTHRPSPRQGTFAGTALQPRPLRGERLASRRAIASTARVARGFGRPWVWRFSFSDLSCFSARMCS
jgi:hypothetical protein